MSLLRRPLLRVPFQELWLNRVELGFLMTTIDNVDSDKEVFEKKGALHNDLIHIIRYSWCYY
jgi:hypothetical protein